MVVLVLLIGTYRAINDVFSTGSITGGGAFDNMFVEGGGDGDTIYLNGNAYALNGSTIQGGQGNDTIAVILSGNSQLSATQILGGGGNDVFSARSAPQSDDCRLQHHCWWWWR